MSTITYIVNGTIGADSVFTGIDGSGYFGGGSIVGDHFWVTWIGTPCQCIGGDPPSFPLPNPIEDVTISIGNQPYGFNPSLDFGPSNFAYGEWHTNPPSHFSLQQVGINGLGVISTSFGFSLNPAAPNGAFQIGATSGTFTGMAVGIPAPVIGTGWLGLLLMIGLLILCARRRLKGES